MPGMLTHSPARVLMELLVAAGYGVDIDDDENGDWPIFIGRSPDRPDDMIRVTDTAGISHGDTQPDGERQEDSGFQIMVRAAMYEEGYLKAQQLAVYLDQLSRVQVSVPTIGTGTGSDSTTYLVDCVMRTSSVIGIGSDVPQGKRQLFSINGLATIRQCC